MPFRFKKNERGFSDFTFRLMRFLVVGGTNILFRNLVQGAEHMPTTGPCFIYGNHSNYFDPFFLNLWMYNEPTAGVMTREQFHKTIPALFMDSVGIVPTSKYVPEPMVIRSILKMIDQRRMIVIFPEGGRRWDGRPKPLIESTLKLYYRTGIPVHPVRLHGSYLSWPRWADYPRAGRNIIEWLPPVYPGNFDDYETFAETCREAIAINEYDAPPECHPKIAFKPASGIQRLLYRCPVTGENQGVYSPDGHQVRSRFAKLTYTMTANSRLTDPDGKEHSLNQLFDHIRTLPMVYDGTGRVLSEPASPLYSVDSSHTLHQHGIAGIYLHSDHISMVQSTRKRVIPLESILYISIEQNDKLSLTIRDETWQFKIRNGSAVQWQDYLRRLKSGEKPVTGN